MRGDKTLAGQYLIAVTTTAVAFGTTCALLIALFPEFVVTLVGVDQSVVAQAAGYMRARAAGVPAVCLIAVLGGAFQAARDAKTYVLRVSQILTLLAHKILTLFVQQSQETPAGVDPRAAHAVHERGEPPWD